MRRDHVELKNSAVRTEYELLGTNRKYHKDFSTVVCFAFRYSLGRQSTAPSFMQDYILENLDCFETYELEQWADEIDSEAQFHNLGDPNIDEPMWRQFQADLRLEVSRRSDILKETNNGDNDDHFPY